MVRAKGDELELSCARAPETKFETFSVRFVDADGDSLRVERIVAEPGRGGNLTGPNTKRLVEGEAATKAAMLAIETYMRNGASASEPRAELLSVGGEGRNAGERALKRLVESKVLVLSNGRYMLTANQRPAGLAAFRRDVKR
jgi:hypothetical protein